MRCAQDPVQVALALDVVQDFVYCKDEVTEHQRDVYAPVVPGIARGALLWLRFAGTNGDAIIEALKKLCGILSTY
jgi:hypothetical protein